MYFPHLTKHDLLRFWEDHFSFPRKDHLAFRKVDRTLFILPQFRDRAYDDVPLPILRGKTISQPTTVMIMTSALDLHPGDKVFEVGSGSGYQAAMLGTLVGKRGVVHTMEVLPELVPYARENLAAAGLTNVTVHEGDGAKGLPGDAPFDKILITAACREFPEPLLKQLRIGGIIVAPVGDQQEQLMLKAVKQPNGGLEYEFLGPFIFSALHGAYGFEE